MDLGIANNYPTIASAALYDRSHFIDTDQD
jgi:hypothetical protein